jgi:hypothetical protein
MKRQVAETRIGLLSPALRCRIKFSDEWGAADGTATHSIAQNVRGKYSGTSKVDVTVKTP